MLWELPITQILPWSPCRRGSPGGRSVPAGSLFQQETCLRDTEPLIPCATVPIPAEAGAAPLLGTAQLGEAWGREGGREANLLRTALLPRILAQGLEIESGGIGKPLILPLAALVWREQGDSREGRGLSAWAGGREELDGESRSATGRPARVPCCEQCPLHSATATGLWEPHPALLSPCCMFNVARGRRGCVIAFLLAISSPGPYRRDGKHGAGTGRVPLTACFWPHWLGAGQPGGFLALRGWAGQKGAVKV